MDYGFSYLGWLHSDLLRNRQVKFGETSALQGLSRNLLSSSSSLEERTFMRLGALYFYFSTKALPLNLVSKSLYGVTLVIDDALLVPYCASCGKRVMI